MSAVIMGSVCCVAAKDQTIPNRTGSESFHRNPVCSPSLSFQWDRWSRVASEIDDLSFRTPHRVSRSASMELKGSLSSDRGNLSDVGSTMENSVTPMSQKSPIHEQLSASRMNISSGKCYLHYSFVECTETLAYE
jgi:hypothetical protein